METLIKEWPKRVCTKCGERKRCRPTQVAPRQIALMCKDCRGKRCLICDRPLNVPGVGDSVDCGGDCAGCMKEAGDPNP